MLQFDYWNFSEASTQLITNGLPPQQELQAVFQTLVVHVGADAAWLTAAPAAGAGPRWRCSELWVGLGII